MRILLSPAKRLNEITGSTASPEKLPHFFTDALKINAVLKKKSAKKLMELQHISHDLAQQNYERNQNWHRDSDAFAPAVNLFNGDAYLGLDAATFSAKTAAYAQNHLYILSGLYGILKPQDFILPYRLEMGTALPVGANKNLYAFWKKKLTQYVAETFDNEPILNLASHEYASVLDRNKLANTFIDVEFKDQNAAGTFKIVSFFAKKARGTMARYVLDNQLTNPEQLCLFTENGYNYSTADSTSNKLVFLRPSNNKF